VPTDLTDLQVNYDSKVSAWYAIYTRHQHEKSVAHSLTTKGFDVFLPLYTTAHRWKDRTKVISLPFFPCYVFLNGGLDRPLDIATTPGISALVSCSGRPAEIPLREIEDVRRAVASGVGVEPHPLLRCGDWVRIKCGSLEGLEGILMRKRNVYRLVLSVGMLGKAVAMEVDALTVERINGNRPAGSVAGHKATIAASGFRTVRPL
jgi:transcription antitermination factor NusG